MVIRVDIANIACRVDLVDIVRVVGMVGMMCKVYMVDFTGEIPSILFVKLIVRLEVDV